MGRICKRRCIVRCHGLANPGHHFGAIFQKSFHQRLQQLAIPVESRKQRGFIQAPVNGHGRLLRFLFSSLSLLRSSGPFCGFNGLEKSSRVERFCEIAVHSGCEASFAVAAHGVSRHGHDGQVRARGDFFLADQLSRLDSTHFRHLHVHQHEIEFVLLDGRERLSSIFRDDHGMPAPLQQMQHEFLIYRIVFSH